MIFVTLNTEPLVSKYCYVLVLFLTVRFVYRLNFKNCTMYKVGSY